jgi:putative ABC transport system permease protein
MVGQFRQITSLTFLVVIVLGSIGLLGGIGVMNINVRLCDREHRCNRLARSHLALERDIVVQFLLEGAKT